MNNVTFISLKEYVGTYRYIYNFYGHYYYELSYVLERVLYYNILYVTFVKF